MKPFKHSTILTLCLISIIVLSFSPAIAQSRYDNALGGNSTSENEGGINTSNGPGPEITGMPPASVINRVQNYSQNPTPPNFQPQVNRNYSSPPQKYRKNAPVLEDIEIKIPEIQIDLMDFSGKTFEELLPVARELMEVDDFENALKCFLTMNKLKANNGEVIFNIAKILNIVGNFKESKIMLQDALKTDFDKNQILTEMIWNHFSIITTISNENDFNTAINDFLEFVKKHNLCCETTPQPVNKEFVLLTGLKRLFVSDEEKPEIKISPLEIFESKTPFSLEKLSLDIKDKKVYLIPDRYTKFSKNQYDLAKSFLQNKEYDSAEEIFLSIIKKHRFNFEIVLLLGDIYKWTDNYEKSKTIYESALKVRPLDPRSLLKLSELEMIQKNYALARNYVKYALSIYPEYNDARAMIVLIDRVEEENIEIILPVVLEKKEVKKEIIPDGFIHENNLSKNKEGVFSSKKDLWLRIGNSFSTKKMFKVKKGKELEIVAQIGSWFHVKTK